ncbi:hypothetical protein LAZ67_14001924 [Cordylochernes scorpioides]|uniref:DDE-1 domain-containing protein n=1 Tax=Cordylochernes scorpioides TaxID=51811 RepID=A0ABY6LBB7_9ARAC|nr:hypothetical protein LAZ67_14001924 [Cordylochernes scorpioides]
MSLVPKEDIIKGRYYLPHHPVIKEKSCNTKLRVVFDASAKTDSGLSLNDASIPGPKIQQDLFHIILRFRIHPVAINADIAKMYRQIKISQEDSEFQRIVWRNDPHDKIKNYRLETVTYGTSCAPFLATRIIKQLALDEQNKRRLLIIGKSAKPRCFRNFSPHFYCTYTSNSKAWMTSSIFQEWLLQFNKQLVSEGRRILLLLDNATSHCVPNDGLSNIKIHFLPPNMTASLQPLDSGIIKSFKAQYRKLQLQKMVELADAHLPTELRLDYAVRYCKMAWDSVSPDSISNCWNHKGIIRFTSTAAAEPLNYENLLDRIRDIFAITPENLMTEREFQLVDDSQEAEMKLTDDNFLVSTVTAK